MLNSKQEMAEKEWDTKLQKQRTKALNGKKDKTSQPLQVWDSVGAEETTGFQCFF